MPDTVPNACSCGVPRRRVLAAGATGIGVIGLAACGTDTAGSGTSSSSSAATTSAGPSTSASGSTAPPTTGGGAGAATGPPLAQLADIEVGESTAATADGKDILITRTGQDTAVAFSAVCTHQGCKVAPAGTELRCPCHGSKYEAATGQVLSGPAPKPLPEVKVAVQDGAVYGA